MKRTRKFLVLIALTVVIGGLERGWAQSSLFSTLKDPATVAQLKAFTVEKAAEAGAATNEPAPGFASFFTAAERGDWLSASNQFEVFRQHAGQYEHAGKIDEHLRGTRWEAVKEIWGAFYFFGTGDEKYPAAYANDIISSIPAGSIYFGGTDPGRFLVTALQKSQVAGDPFFTLTQNALADSTYLDYLRSIYGGKIYIPTAEDSQNAFENFRTDAEQRLAKHQLRPGENIYKDGTGKLQIGGQVAVMEINGLLVKTIFDRNPQPDFYIEESFPLDWMYPQLEPHGLIFKLNRQPADQLPAEVVQSDLDYWAKYITPMIGGWLNDDTSVTDVTAFVKKIYLEKDLSGFQGDPQFIHSPDSQRMFSKLRSSQAGLYAWRADHTADPDDKRRMARAADLAFRQAWALCPYSPEAVNRYVNFLVEQKRTADALTLAEAAVQMPALSGPAGDQLRSLVEQLKKSPDPQ